MASLGSYIRSAAQGTFSAYRSVPIRWRLAGGSAALTFVILAAFAAIVGVLTTNQLRGQFNNQVQGAADELGNELHLNWVIPGVQLACDKTVSLTDYVSAAHAQIRVFDTSGAGVLLCTQDHIRIKGEKPPVASPGFSAPTRSGTTQQLGHMVIAQKVGVKPSGQVWLLYAVPLSNLDHTLARVQAFLLLGVLGGTALALLAGLATAQRAIRPIVELTDAAREIERTRDPSRHVPLPQAEDEVAELARTLEGMLQSLDAARSGTEAVLGRQREFVADASHELRTPLTSVLTSLELLAEELDGEQADIAQAALRSARRMRRLVGDLLLLARADAERTRPRLATRLDEVLTEAASEIEPVAESHELSVSAEPVVVSGARDESASAGPEPDRKRGQAHATGHAHPRLDGARGRQRGAGGGGRRARDPTGARRPRLRAVRAQRSRWGAWLRTRAVDRSRGRRVARRIGHARAVTGSGRRPVRGAAARPGGR